MESNEVGEEVLKPRNNTTPAPTENIVVYPGRRALHIFDIDKERWIMNSEISGHQYEDIYHEVKNRNNPQQPNSVESDSDDDNLTEENYDLEVEQDLYSDNGGNDTEEEEVGLIYD